MVFTISSALGGTYNAIKLFAEEYADKIKIHVIDTKSAAFCEGMHAVVAAQLLNKGLSTEEVLRETAWGIEHQEFIGVDGKLDYLIYNGRLKGAKAFMGQMLKICPVLRFNKEGEIVAVESVRTPKKALMRTCELLCEIIGDRRLNPKPPPPSQEYSSNFHYLIASDFFPFLFSLFLIFLLFILVSIFTSIKI